jgi:amino acid adenylation domain-containing protein
MVHRIFEEVAARQPRDTALSFASGSWSYGELNARANQLARAIQARHVTPGSCVAVCLDRSPELIAALLGVLKAGCAYVPVDASYPSERISYMLQDVAAPLLLTDSALSSRVSLTCNSVGTGVMRVDSEPERIGLESAENLDMTLSREASSGDLAYVMYTSGSTGIPKGVMVPHRGILRLVVDATYARFSPEEVFLQLAPVSFDASTFEIWGSLLNGARLAIAPPGVLSLDEIGGAIRRHGVTTLWLTAGLFHLAVDQNLDCLRRLRQLLAGGDALSPRHVRRAAEALPHCTLINGYGPTETTTFACCHTITAADLTGRAIPIGRPIERTEVQLLDAALQPVPDGEAGEIVIGGDGVALGYLNQPGLTADRFFPNEAGDLLYRTGDRGRRRADGVIEFLGRADDQVKIAGHRVEPREIEAYLTQVAGIAQAAVVASTPTQGEKRLVACLVAAGPHRRTVSELRAELAGRLPRFMIPSNFYYVDQLPLSPNGKVDYIQLSTQLADKPLDELPDQPGLEPDSVEGVIRAVWRRVLGIAHPGAEENFFDLGGDSLMLLGAHADLERDLGRKIPLNALFEFSSIRELTVYLSAEPAPRDAVRNAADRARKQREAVALARAVRSGGL